MLEPCPYSRSHRPRVAVQERAVVRGAVSGARATVRHLNLRSRPGSDRLPGSRLDLLENRHQGPLERLRIGK